MLQLTAWLVVPAALAQDASAEARQAFEEGREAYESGAFEVALTSFERSYALSGHPKLLFKFGRSAEADGQTARAIEAYEAYLTQVPEANNRPFVEARLAKLRPKETHLAVAQSPIPSVTLEPPPVQQPLPPVPSEQSQRPRWYKSPWVLGALGALVAGGVATAVVFTRDREPRRVSADGYAEVP